MAKITRKTTPKKVAPKVKPIRKVEKETREFSKKQKGTGDGGPRNK